MRSAPLLLVLVSGWAWADAPDFTRNAFTFGLDYGYGIWQLDRNHLVSQVGQPDADLFIGEQQNTQTATARIGFDILGHVTIEGELTGTGWNLSGSNRGGAGFLAALAAWHPLRLFVTESQRQFDASVFGGAGYGITGQDRGMDGFIWEVGARGNYYFNPWFSLTVFARWVFLDNKTFYIDYNHRDQPNASEPLPQGSGGDFFTVGAGIEMRFAP